MHTVRYWLHHAIHRLALLAPMPIQPSRAVARCQQCHAAQRPIHEPELTGKHSTYIGVLRRVHGWPTRPVWQARRRQLLKAVTMLLTDFVGSRTALRSSVMQKEAPASTHVYIQASAVMCRCHT